MNMRWIAAAALVAAGTALAAEQTNTAGQADGGWTELFDGKSAAGWRPYGGKGAIGEGWKVEEGILKKLAGKKGGDLVSEKKYGDFELYWEWRVAPGANNGVKYLVTEDQPGAPGHEYQMIDDLSEKWSKLAPKDKTASFYDVLPPAADKPLKPAGEWNQSRIVVRGRQVEHWLNGAQVLTYELESEPVKAALAKSKFAKFPDFGKKIDGHIMLTDHGDEAWYRVIRIRAAAP
jgi:hypothetical protein